MSTHVETHIEVALTGRNRQTVLFRWILAAPVVVFLYAFTQMAHWGLTSTLLVVPVIMTLLFRGVYPSYALTYNHALMELSTRAAAYVFLLTDEYPSIERNPNVAVIFPDVEGGKKLSRGLPLVKWIFAIPLYIVGAIYLVLSIVLTVFAWIMTSVSGTYPEWAANVVLGTIEYWNRVYGYSIALVSDEYPPFTLN
jgi:hypothetical protein